MTTLAEQVASLTVGDWVEARFEYNTGWTVTTGELELDSLGSLIVNSFLVRYGDNKPSIVLTSIICVSRPIPQEPEVGSFAHLDDGYIIQRHLNDYPKKWISNGSAVWKSWPEIYPHIIRLYMPSGELVTGFDYYKSEGEGNGDK